MNITEKLERSKSTEKIDFTKYLPIDKQEPLVKVESSEKILIEPCWTIPGDFEGGKYAEYIADHPEYDGLYVRTELLKRLKSAASSLPKEYYLVVRAGHRPISVQKKLLIDCASDSIKDNPSISEQEALDHARIFVSDPDIEVPPHVCGAAVDVEIKDVETGELLDFGSKMNDDTKLSYLYCSNLREIQKSNRLMSTTAMFDAGFANCKFEWWHFSYGDQVWA